MKIQEVTVKGKKVGEFCSDGVYRKWVNYTQVFRNKGFSIGIMENVIQQLTNEPSWVAIEVDVIDGDYQGKYRASKEEWMSPDIRTDDCGWGLQRFFPLKRMTKMARFRTKSVVIEATQWFKNGDHPKDNVWRSFEDTGFRPTEPREGQVVRYYRHPDVDGQTVCSKCGHTMHVHGWIDTLGDGHNVCPADWIITGVEGEYYPCKPDVFNLTYEKV